MTRQIVIRQPSSIRGERLLDRPPPAPCCGGIHLAEVAGGATAECAAVCCCCPCGLANFLVLFLYKVPTGLCRRALRKRRLQRLLKKGLLPQQRRRRCQCGCDETELQIHPVFEENCTEMKSEMSSESEKEVTELEKEMWERFYSTGFWRSPSQREFESSKKL